MHKPIWVNALNVEMQIILQNADAAGAFENLLHELGPMYTRNVRTMLEE
jgi:hypothetical protein